MRLRFDLRDRAVMGAAEVHAEWPERPTLLALDELAAVFPYPTLPAARPAIASQPDAEALLAPPQFLPLLRPPPVERPRARRGEKVAAAVALAALALAFAFASSVLFFAF